MAFPVVFRAEALDDLAAAFQWYEERQPGLGHDFMAEVEEKLGSVSAEPKRYQQIRGPVRRAMTRHFPYGIFFVDETSRVTILGVLHHARHPKHWRGRSP